MLAPRRIASPIAAQAYIVDRAMYLLSDGEFSTDNVVAAATTISREMQCDFLAGESPGVMSVAGVIFRANAARNIRRRPTPNPRHTGTQG